MRRRTWISAGAALALIAFLAVRQWQARRAVPPPHGAAPALRELPPSAPEGGAGPPIASAAATASEGEAPGAPDAPPGGAEVEIEGVVVDPDGRPVPQETVELRLRDGDDEERALAEGDTDDDGRFTLDARPGDYVVRVWLDPLAAVAVRAPARGVRLQLSRGASVEGVLLDADGRPVAGGEVTVADAAADDDAPSRTRTALTDGGGRFRVLGLRAGPHLVLGARPLPGPVEHRFAPNVATAEVELTRRETATLELRLGPEQVIAGTVVDEAGEPVEDAVVDGELADPADRLPPAFVHLRGHAEATTDAQGRFTLEGLPGGAHELRAVRDGYHPVGPAATALAGTRDARIVLRRLPHVRGRVVDEHGVPLTRFLLDGRPVDAGDGRFQRAIVQRRELTFEIGADGYAPLRRTVDTSAGLEVDLGDLRLSRGRVLTGHVVDAVTGAAVPGAQVSRRAAGAATGDWSDATRSDAEGRFAVRDVGDGVQLRAVQDGYGPGAVTLAPGQATATLRLPPEARIAVTVRDARGGPGRFPVAIASADGVELVAMEAPDPDGRLVATGLAAGTYLVVPFELGENPLHVTGRTVEVSAGQTTEVELRERAAGATVVVHLSGPGAACAGRTVVLVPGDATRIRDVAGATRAAVLALMPELAGPARTFRLVEPGRYTVLVMAGGDAAPALFASPVEVGTAAEQAFRVEVPEPLPPLAP